MDINKLLQKFNIKRQKIQYWRKRIPRTRVIWELCSDLSSNMTGLYLDGGWENKESGGKNANVLPSNCSPLLSSLLLFWLSFVACGILVLQPGMEPGSPAVEIWSPNHRTAREFPAHLYFWVIERRKWERHSQKIIFLRPKIREFLSLHVGPFEAVMGVGVAGLSSPRHHIQKCLPFCTRSQLRQPSTSSFQMASSAFHHLPYDPFQSWPFLNIKSTHKERRFAKVQELQSRNSSLWNADPAPLRFYDLMDPCLLKHSLHSLVGAVAAYLRDSRPQPDLASCLGPRCRRWRLEEE